VKVIVEEGLDRVKTHSKTLGNRSSQLLQVIRYLMQKCGKVQCQDIFKSFKDSPCWLYSDSVHKICYFNKGVLHLIINVGAV
jgi:hypothetical protein